LENHEGEPDDLSCGAMGKNRGEMDMSMVWQ